MDLIGLLYPAEKSIAAVIFPIVETLKRVSLITATVFWETLCVSESQS
jgi:hypothetical protein